MDVKLTTPPAPHSENIHNVSAAEKDVSDLSTGDAATSSGEHSTEPPPATGATDPPGSRGHTVRTDSAAVTESTPPRKEKDQDGCTPDSAAAPDNSGPTGNKSDNGEMIGTDSISKSVPDDQTDTGVRHIPGDDDVPVSLEPPPERSLKTKDEIAESSPVGHSQPSDEAGARSETDEKSASEDQPSVAHKSNQNETVSPITDGRDCASQETDHANQEAAEQSQMPPSEKSGLSSAENGDVAGTSRPKQSNIDAPSESIIRSDGENDRTEEKQVASENKDDSDVCILSEVAPRKKGNGNSGSEDAVSRSRKETCIVCQKVCKCKFNIMRNGDIKHLCGDVCFQAFQETPVKYLTTNRKSGVTGAAASTSLVMNLCAYCMASFQSSSLSKYEVKEGEIKTFCSDTCCSSYKALRHYCVSCKRPIPPNSFIPAADDPSQGYCSKTCRARAKVNGKGVASDTPRDVADPGRGMKTRRSTRAKTAPVEVDEDNDVQVIGTSTVDVQPKWLPIQRHACSVCGKSGEAKHEVTIDRKVHRLCSDSCFSTFRYTNKLGINECSFCGAHCYKQGSNPQSIQFEGVTKKFCSITCINAFKVNKSRVMPCTWCSVKKTNFDMIERVDARGHVQLFCSLNCLSLYRVNLQATSNDNVVCDQCRRVAPACYHLTMSDASVRNFCQYSCVVAFQSRFVATPNKGARTSSAGPRTISAGGHSRGVSAVQNKNHPIAPNVGRTRQSPRQAAKQGLKQEISAGPTTAAVVPPNSPPKTVSHKAQDSPSRSDTPSREPLVVPAAFSSSQELTAERVTLPDSTASSETSGEVQVKNILPVISSCSSNGVSGMMSREDPAQVPFHAFPDSTVDRDIGISGQNQQVSMCLQNSDVNAQGPLSKAFQEHHNSYVSSQQIDTRTDSKTLEFASSPCESVPLLSSSLSLSEKDKHGDFYAKASSSGVTLDSEKQKCSRAAVTQGPTVEMQQSISQNGDNQQRQQQQQKEQAEGKSTQELTEQDSIKGQRPQERQPEKQQVEEQTQMQQPMQIEYGQEIQERNVEQNQDSHIKEEVQAMHSDDMADKRQGLAEEEHHPPALSHQMDEEIKPEPVSSTLGSNKQYQSGVQTSFSQPMAPSNEGEFPNYTSLDICGDLSQAGQDAGLLPAKRRGRPPGKHKRKKHASSRRPRRSPKPASDMGIYATDRSDPDFEPRSLVAGGGSVARGLGRGRGPRPLVLNLTRVVSGDSDSPDDDGSGLRKSSRKRRPTYKVSLMQQQQAPVAASPTTSAPVPVISNVVSLAAAPATQSQGRSKVSPANNATDTGKQSVGSQIIIQPPPPKPVRNKSLLCKPFTQTKATSCRPHTQDQEVQVDLGESTAGKTALIPVPVPIYVPMPMAMYSAPQPYPLPLPIPIPVPIFIPTTKKSADGILRHIKEIQERMPADPFEAELLMMAEAVANADKSYSSEESDVDDTNEAAPEPTFDASLPLVGEPEPPTIGPGGDMGEDMLSMALRMAEMRSTDDGALDLEDSIHSTPISQPPPEVVSAPEPDFSTIDQDSDILSATRAPRGSWRGAKRRRGRGPGSGSGRSKRARVEETPVEIDPSSSLPPAGPPAPPAPPPLNDTHSVLKFSFGVNAWKHWVLQKNTQLEKASSARRFKLFKTDLMQCTSDELNYSLCLFVKEVRKPNGDEYAPDSIYYLCLGIQQYLFENGRIDNIFTDFYYEKFTECLNEILQRYEVRLNAQGLLVCRIEEEHLWEAKQLGAHSPHVLLNTLIYFNTRYFLLRTPEDHVRLSFSHIMKHWKKTNVLGTRTPGRSVYLRYYAPVNSKDPTSKHRKREEVPVYEQGENVENPLRCPVKLYEFYLSKCPESIRNRNDVFYLVPERSCVPDSPVWYSTASLGLEAMSKMLNRVRVVKEIQEKYIQDQVTYMS